jgi:hypothetical protein
MSLESSIANLKLVSSTQVDFAYFGSVAPQVFPEPAVYTAILADVQCINQLGNQLFNYFSNPDPLTQKIWYVALNAALTQAIQDTQDLIAVIPVENPKAADMKTILQIFIADCVAIQAIIPKTEQK